MHYLRSDDDSDNCNSHLAVHVHLNLCLLHHTRWCGAEGRGADLSKYGLVCKLQLHFRPQAIPITVLMAEISSQQERTTRMATTTKRNILNTCMNKWYYWCRDGNRSTDIPAESLWAVTKLTRIITVSESRILCTEQYRRKSVWWVFCFLSFVFLFCPYGTYCTALLYGSDETFIESRN